MSFDGNSIPLSPKTGLDIFVTFACDWECGLVFSQIYELNSVLDIIGSIKYGCEVIVT